MKASAGSGKTYRLARKYISIILGSSDRYAYRHVLAVTFTNKATDEMKSRILRQLHILATEPAKSGYHDYFVPSVFPSDEDLKHKARTVLNDILHDYSAFAVSTIDRFFQQTLKAFSREIGQFASYQVELDKGSLVAESVDRILDSLDEKDESLLPWLTDNVLEKIEQGERYSMDANLLEMALRLKSPQRQEAMEQAGISPDIPYSKDDLNRIRKACRQIIASFTENVRVKARAALDVLEQAGVDPAESNRKFMSVLYLYDAVQEGNFVEAPTAAFLTKAADRDLWFAKSKAKMLLPRVSPFLEAPLEDFCALWGDDYALYNTAYILDRQVYGLGVAGELQKTFAELVREKNVLCIDDSNTLLRDIIDGSDAPFVYEKLGVRYEHFLLDEFQDTAKVQWMNFSPLLHNSDASGGQNLIVGDVKQSIYRWRGSDWNLLESEVPGEFHEVEEEVLDTNYRSLANVVGFNNAFFKASAEVIGSLGCCRDSAGQLGRIYSDVEQKVARNNGPSGCVSVTFCDKEQELDKILECIGEVRASGAGLSDIAVLVRSNAIGEDVSSFLIENGIAVVTDDSLKVRSSVTVRRLVSLLSYADNPEDTVNGYLAAALGIEIPDSCSSLEDLAESLLRSLQKNDPEQLWKGEVLYVQSFMDCLQDYVSMNGNSLRGFLKYWEGEDPSISSPSSGDSVRVMTVHKSKGLDFPYVILPFLESVTMFKAGSRWCAPELAGTPLEGVAEGVYDVMLSKAADSTLFAGDYRRESFLQCVDNMNIVYVAMTRAACGMHIIAKMPSDKCRAALQSGDFSVISDFSGMLWRFVSSSEFASGLSRSSDETCIRFDFGDIPDFAALRKPESEHPDAFPVAEDGEFPSFALNSDACDSGVPVNERGRLRLSADAMDFFSEDGHAGISASNRIRGVVLHDILSRVAVPSDLAGAVRVSVDAGEITEAEADEIKELLSVRIEEGAARGWFPDDRMKVMNEVSIIASDGSLHRPDRVVYDSSKAVIIDYKFGEHEEKYRKQLLKYAEILSGTGVGEVSAMLWYVRTGEVVKVC